MAGYKSNSVACTTWSRVKRHLQKVVPVEEPDESDDAEGLKGGVNKRKRAAKKVDDSSGDEAGPSKKQSRGRMAQEDEPKAHKDGSGDEIANEANTKKARVQKAAKADDTNEDGAVGKAGSQSAAKDGATPDNDESAALDCITVKDSDGEAGPSTKKGGKKAQKGNAGAGRKGKAKAELGTNDNNDKASVEKEKPKKGPVANKSKGKTDDTSNEILPAIKAGKKTTKGVSAKQGKGKGKAVGDSDASDDALNEGKTKDAKVGKHKVPSRGKGVRQVKIGKNAPVKTSKKASDEEASDGA